MTEKQYPKLPEPEQATDDWSVGGVIVEYFTSDQMRAYVDADRAMRAAQAAPAAVAGPSDRIPIEDSIAWQETGTGVERNAVMVSGRTWYRDDHPLLAPTTQAAPPPAVQQGDGGTDIGQLGRRTVLDAIRSAYDIGYSDARNARTYPGDSAPGYKGRDVEKDHGGALIAKLNALAARPHTAAPAAHGDALPREEFAWMVVQEACETEPADEDDPECIRILRRDLKSAVLAAFLREDAARMDKEGDQHG